jgi:competence protein ComEC
VDETDRFAFGDVILDVVAPTSTREGTVPEDPNEASVVILLTFGETTLLLTGDATADIEGEIANAVGDIDVLKVGHHGSMTSSSYAFLETTTPEIGVISVGAENTYGHPHPAILKRLAERNIRVLRTDQDGDILLISDGGEPTVEPSPLPF